MSNTILCAQSCRNTIIAQFFGTCQYSETCYCKTTAFINAYIGCIDQNCDIVNGKVVWQEVVGYCAVFGVTLPTAVPTQLAPTQNSQPTTFTYTGNAAAATTLFSFGPTDPASIQSSQASSNGLSPGAIAGIAVSVTLVVLLLVGALLFRYRRRKRNKPAPRPSEDTIVYGEAAEGWDHNAYTDVKPDVYVAPVPHFLHELSTEQPSELSTERASSVAEHGQTQDVPNDSENSSHPRIPDESHSNAELTLSPVDTEVSSPRQHSSGPSHHNITAAEPANLSHGDSPFSPESAYSASETQDTHMTTRTSVRRTGRPEPDAQELPTTPHSPISPVFSSPPASSATPHALAGASEATTAADNGDKHDEELRSMTAEIEAVRAEKERLKQLQVLDERERELSRRIVSMGLSRSAK